MNRLLPATTVALLAAGCNGSTSYEPYYADRVDPEIADVEPMREQGNAGGQVVTVHGSGFGDAADELVVQFGTHNAEILGVTDSAIEVRTPVGPVTGGPVDLLVATPDGFTQCQAPGASGGESDCRVHYVYDTSPATGDSDFYQGQRHYVLVHNLWTSCYGGMYSNPAIGGCDTIAYFGQTGIEGVGEFFRFAYPRVHSASQGFVSGADIRPDWQVVEQYEQPFPSGVDDLRKRVGDFQIRNPLFEGETYCVDMALPPSEGEARTCSGVDIQRYDLGELRFCEGTDPVSGGDFSYRADWPVKRNFFRGEEGDFGPVDVRLDISDPSADEDLGLLDYPLTLPPPLVVEAELGFDDSLAWAVSSMADCGDGDGDGEATLDEHGVEFSWEPVPEGLIGPDDDRLEQVASYLHVSVSFLDVGWFLGDGWGLRASTVVPDDHLYDPQTGRSYLGIPNEVLYQFPTPNPEWSGESLGLGTGKLGSFDDHASFMVLEVHRITDYRLQTDGGPLVFSYVTGDMSFPAWENPAEQGDCGDCLDGDGDGWTDSLDPDCNRDLDGPGVEEHATTDYTCNDGLDNDGDGLVDADDPDCERGWDAESNCDDGEDNDGDGWVDDLDGECVEGDPFAQESGADDPAWTCSNGVDDDGDGWIDAADPGCSAGDDAENDGFSGTACNDGVDNDGNHDPDDLDLYCVAVGASADSEAPPSYGVGCSNGDDDDGDGFVDALDPDCELPPHDNESGDFLDPAEWPVVTGCYDGIDNDGDGKADAEDPNCWNSTLGFVPDGFLPGEDVLRQDQAATGCNDGVDNDGDGWVDGSDPDCEPGTEASEQQETGYDDSYVCNNGQDDNGDGLIDSESSYCDDGTGNFEGP